MQDIIQSLTTINPKKTPNTAFEYVDVSSVSRSDHSISETKTLSGSEAPSRARRRVQTGDVLFATIRPTLQRISVVPEHLDGAVCSTGFYVLRPREELLSRFMFYYLFSSTFAGEMATLERGASYPAVSDSDVKEHRLHLPPLPEQERIVTILDEAFAAISTATKNAERNLANAQALFANYRDYLFLEISRTWQPNRFDELCEFVRGPFGGSLKKSCFVEDGFAIYEQRHAINDRFDNVRYFIDKRKFSEMARFEVQPGNLIMSCSGTIGRVAIVPPGVRAGIINQALLKIVAGPKVVSSFVQQWMRSTSFQEQVAAHSKGAALQNVASVKVLKEISMPVSSIREQKTLVESCKCFKIETNRLLSIRDRQLSNLSTLKQSLLHKAFTGELTANNKAVDRTLAEAGV